MRIVRLEDNTESEQIERPTEMTQDGPTHDSGCEKATGTTCECPCGGAGHHNVWIAAITDDPSGAECMAQTRKVGKLNAAGEPSGRTPAPQARNGLAVIVADLVLDVVEAGISDDDAGPIRDLTRAISRGLIDEITAELAKTDRSRWPRHHFWCVGIAAICQTCDEGWVLAETNINDIIDRVLDTIRSEPDLQAPKTAAGVSVIGFGGSKRRPAFDTTIYDRLLRVIVKHAAEAILEAAKAIGEETAMRYVRLVGALVCPDPSVHAEVVNHCVWPLVSHPLASGISSRLQEWLGDAYVYQPPTASHYQNSS